MQKNISEIALDSIPLLRRARTKANREKFKEIISEEKDEKTIDDYLGNFIDMEDNDVVVVNSRKRTDFDVFLNINYKTIINFHRINDVKFINKYFEKVNSLLPQNGIYIGTFESSKQRKTRILNKYPKIYAYPFYFATFVLKRIFPKWAFTKKIYFFLTQGKNRYLSIAEILSRLVSCGFEIVDYQEKTNKTFFVAKKVGKPSFDPKPSYGVLIGLKRIGKNGKKITVYKFRTMHPYSEYLQSFIHKKNNLSEGGKFKDDFRISTVGKFLRKYWIDELPMFINLFKGDLKLVGVRPLSQHYLSLYTKELQELRFKTKPGLIPPFYADMPKTLDEIMKSESEYLVQYYKNPILTDIKYMWRIFVNILFRKARSS
ncbi:MAG: sugar transferase [Ignavibacteriales bacterium]|nr:sugar transferase [Ignavibacteriales bacterium]